MILKTKIDKEKISLYILYLSIIFAPLRCYGFVIGGFNFSIFRIVGLLMILSDVLFHRKVIFNNQSKCMALIILITFLQMSYSPYLSGSYSSFVSQTYGFIWIFFAYQVLIRTKEYSGVINAILISSIFPLALGLYQWIVYKATGSIPNLPLSFMVSSQGKLGLSYNIYARITSCFGDPAYMTTFFVGVFAVAIQHLVSEHSKGFNSKFKTVFCLSIIILIILETVMSISLSGVLGLTVSVLLFVIFNANKLKKFRKIFFIILILGLGFSIYFMTSGSELIEILRFKMETGDQTYSNMYGRSNYVKNALNVWLMNPFLGGGFGSLRINGGFSSAHSSLLTILAQQGLFVFVFNIYILLYFPFRIYRLLKKYGDEDILNLYIGPFLGLLSVLVLTLGYDTLYSLDFCYVLIAVVSSFASCCKEINFDK